MTWKESDNLPAPAPVARRPGRPPTLNTTAYGLARLHGYKPRDACVIAGSQKKGRALSEQSRRQERHPQQKAEFDRLANADGTLEAHVAMTWPRAWLMCQAKLLAMLADPSIGDGNALQVVKLVAQLTGNLEADGSPVTVVTLVHTEEARERILQMQSDPTVQHAALRKLKEVATKNGK